MRNKSMIKLVVKAWKYKLGHNRKYFGEDVQRAMVAAEVMSCMMSATDPEECPDAHAGIYVEVYKEACKALLLWD